MENTKNTSMTLKMIASNNLEEIEVIEFFTQTRDLFENEEHLKIAQSIVSNQSAASLSESVNVGKRLSMFNLDRWNIQGHNYELNYIKAERMKLRNLFYKFKLNDKHNQEGYDVVRTNIFTKSKKYIELKSGKHAKIRSKIADIGVTTQESALQNQHLQENQVFLSRDEVEKSTDKVIKKLKKNKLPQKFTIGNIAKASVISAGIGFSIAVTVESIKKYKMWKNGEITTKEYLETILIKGGESGTASLITTGLMIPISTTILKLSLSYWISIPISFYVGSKVYGQVDKSIKKSNIFRLRKLRRLKINRKIKLLENHQ